MAVYRATVTSSPSPLIRAGLCLGGLALAALSFSACSNSTTSTATSKPAVTTTTVPETNPACELLTPSQISDTMGYAVGAARVRNYKGSTECTYPAHDGHIADSIIVTFRGGVTPTMAAQQEGILSQAHGKVSNVPTSTGQAYYFTTTGGGATVTTLVTLINETQISVTSTASVKKAEDLTQQLLDALKAQATTTTSPAG